MFKNRCYNGGNKHRFKPRYSVIPPEAMKEFQGSLYSLKETIKCFSKVIYEGDVCTWCGKVVNKER